MKALICLCSLSLLVGCTTPTYTLAERQAMRSMLQDGGVRAHSRHEAASPATITMSTRFAALCPYDGQLTFSQSCIPSGGSSMPEGKTMQTWSITFVCPACGMPFSDSRQQVVLPTKSIQLPVGSGSQMMAPPLPPKAPRQSSSLHGVEQLDPLWVSDGPDSQNLSLFLETDFMTQTNIIYGMEMTKDFLSWEPCPPEIDGTGAESYFLDPCIWGESRFYRIYCRGGVLPP